MAKTPARREQDDWEEAQEAKTQELQQQVETLLKQLAEQKKHNAQVEDHLAQIHAQVTASVPASAVQGPRIPKAEHFEGNRTKLRGFLTQMDMYIDVNKVKLPSEASKVIFMLTYLRGQAWNWLEPYIRDYYEKASDEWSAMTTEIFGSYGSFRRYLERIFGDIDATRTAERKLQKNR